jgi:hypothetical protein
MHLKKTLLLLLGATLFIISGCKKKEKETAAISDYFSCDVNGKHWQAIVIDPATPFAISYLHKNMFMLEGIDNSLQSVKIVLIDSASKNTSSGTFPLSWFPFKSTGYWHNYGSYYPDNVTKDPGYCTDSIYTGTFTMSYDETGKRATGTFEFRARYYDSVSATTKEVEVTNGKFSTVFKEIQ